MAIENENWRILITLLPENVRNIYCDILGEIGEKLYLLSQRCESPIEQIMAFRIFRFIISQPRYEMEYIEQIEITGIMAQKEITINGTTYRADFAIKTLDKTTGQEVTFLIECDGHYFHEKTKEQAKRDKKKDRDLTAAGYVVFRYTGSEINNNPDIAKELFSDIKSTILQRRLVDVCQTE